MKDTPVKKLKTGIILSSLLVFLISCNELVEIPFIALKSNFFASRSLIQLGDTIQFRQISTEVARFFEWNFGDGNYSVDADPQHIYKNYGLYTVQLNAFKNDGKTKDSIVRQIRVLPKTTTATNSSTYGRALADETGMAFDHLPGVGYVFAGRRNVSSLVVLFTNENRQLAFPEIEINNLATGLLNVESVLITSDRGCVIVGYYEYNFNATDNHSFIIKLDQNGDEDWRVVNATSRDEKYSAVVEVNNAYYVAGTVVNINQESATSKIVVDVYDDDGSLDDQFELGNNWSVYDIEPTQDGGFVMACQEGNRPMLLRLNSSLEFIRRTLPFNGKGLGVTILKDGDFAMVGEIAPTTQPNGRDSTNSFISKIDFFGNEIWRDTIVLYNEKLNDIYETATNELIVVGSHSNPITLDDIVVSKYNANGTLTSLRLIGGNRRDFARRMVITSGNKIVVFGTTEVGMTNRRDFYFIELDSNLQ